MGFPLLRPDPLHELGTQEREALLLYGKGYTLTDIATLTGKSRSTIKNQLESCRNKFGVRSTKDAYFALVRSERKA